MNEDEIEPEVSVEEVDDEHVQHKGIKDVLEHISGVDEREAEILHDHGYHSEEEIRNAEQMELAGIEGIGNALAAWMKEDVGGVEVANEGMEVTVAEDVPYTFESEIYGISQPAFYMSGDGVPIELGDDVDEITLKKDGEERAVDVDEVFGEEEMDCTCGPNEGCSECPDGKHGFSTGEKMSISGRGRKTYMFMGGASDTELEEIEKELEGADVDTEAIDDEVEQEFDEDRAVCASPYCEQWADSCSKHGDAS